MPLARVRVRRRRHAPALVDDRRPGPRRRTHGVQVATSDAQGRLVLLDKARRRARSGSTRAPAAQRTYATFADLPPCLPIQTGPTARRRCATATAGELRRVGARREPVRHRLPQAVIWRVPPGGGAAQVWLTDRRLDGGEFGTTGHRARRRPADARSSARGARPGGAAATRRPASSTRSRSAPTASRATCGSCGRAGRRTRPTASASRGPASSTWRWLAGEPDRRGGARRQRARALPELVRRRRQRLAVPFDTPSSARFLGTPPDRRQPELHR